MIDSSVNQVIYRGNGQTTAFTFNFKVLEAKNVRLIRVDVAGKETEITSDYYVDMEASKVYYPGYAPGAEEPNTQRPPVLQDGEKLVIYRDVPITQEVDLPENYPFNLIEDMADKGTIIDQQLFGSLERSLKINRSAYAEDFDGTIPVVAGKTFRFSDDGKRLEATEDPGKVIDVAQGLLAATQANAADAQNAANVATSFVGEYDKAKTVLESIDDYKQQADANANIVITKSAEAVTAARESVIASSDALQILRDTSLIANSGNADTLSTTNAADIIGIKNELLSVQDVVSIAPKGIAGTINSTTITYWASGSGKIAYFDAKPNTTYSIKKLGSSSADYGNKFAVAYADAEALAKNVALFGYVNFGDTATSAEFTTGATAKKVVIQIASGTSYNLNNIIKNITVSYTEGVRDDIARARLDEIESKIAPTVNYANALPKSRIYMTKGIPESWYYKSCVTPSNYYTYCGIGNTFSVANNDRIDFINDTAINSSNGYTYSIYDTNLTNIEKVTANQGYGYGRTISEENLPNCSLLALGDSTVDQAVMTARLKAYFTSKGRTLTLKGTIDDGNGNYNEGRAGWKAADYYTNRQYNGVVNPFYNPATATFDFSYYMNTNDIGDLDYIVIQLGINDLTSGSVEEAWESVKGIIDSIIAYDTNIKIILNLPTTPNSDWSQLSVFEPLYRNRVIRYNALAISNVKASYQDFVRCSYCHLILNPDTDIRDGVHPSPTGYEKMAMELVNQINNWQDA